MEIERKLGMKNLIRKIWDWEIKPRTGSAVGGKGWMQLGHPEQEFLPEDLGLLESKLGCVSPSEMLAWEEGFLFPLTVGIGF